MKKLIQNILSIAFCIGCSTAPLVANQNLNYQFENIDKYAEDVPGIGLISESISFDGITISNFSFENDKKFIFVEPEKNFSARMHYVLDAQVLKTLHRHHFIIGLHKSGPQGCILHSYGVRDKEGDVCVTLQAPKKPGVYQVRFCHSEGLTDEQAYKAWYNQEGKNANTIVGIVVVKK